MSGDIVMSGVPVPRRLFADEFAMAWCKRCQVFHMLFKRNDRLIAAANVPLADIMEALPDDPEVRN